MLYPEDYGGGGILVFIGEHDDAELGRHTDSSNIDTEQCKRSAEDAG
jgi:hypothetical protein